MTKIYFTILSLAVAAFSAPVIGFDCPATSVPFASPVTPWEDSGNYAWHGSEELAVYMSRDGSWYGMGPDRNYADKFWWWQKGYDAKTEPKPNLVVTAKRLDLPADLLTVDDTTSGYGDRWNAMLIGMNFPSAGCWEVSGHYRGSQLTVVFNVGKKPPR